MTTHHDTGLIKYAGETAYIDPHKYQWRAWNSLARFVFILAGTQGGKTSFLPWWLNREIDNTAVIAGENDYLAVTASFDLFKLKFLPEMKRVFEDILQRGRYWSGLKVIELCDPEGHFWAEKADDIMWGRIILRSAQSEGGLESSTAKAAILDECGMDEFRVNEWEAVQRRLSLNLGRVCGGTTLYNRGWIKTDIYDRWKAGDPDYEIIQFPSYANPSFPKEEYERMARTLPKWKLNMFYRGEFDVPEGLIFSNFDTARHTIDPFPIPDDWIRYGFHDFGGVNMAGLGVAENPDTEQLIIFDEYLEGHKTTKQHAKEFKTWKPKRAIGGAWSEDQYRLEFGASGYPILKPSIKDVEVGIDRVFAQFAVDGITIFKTCTMLIDELGTYSREMDRDGEVTEKIKDKNDFHLTDSLRYGIATLRATTGKIKVRKVG
jgi:hypothetical protein